MLMEMQHSLQIRSALEEHFGSCGDITRMSIPKDYDSGAIKGFVPFPLFIFLAISLLNLLEIYAN